MAETDTTIETGRVYHRAADVISRKVGTESILVPIRQNVGDLDYIYTLSPVAARIWELLDGTKSVGAIAAAICDEYEVELDQAAADVAELVTDLEKVSLVLQTNESNQ
jgi:Coenzyme PQQ synthesis protein D (PqqD)